MREKTTIERRERKLKPPIKKISATQKYIYTFGEIEIGTTKAHSTHKDKHDSYYDGTIFLKVIINEYCVNYNFIKSVTILKLFRASETST